MDSFAFGSDPCLLVFLQTTAAPARPLAAPATNERFAVRTSRGSRARPAENPRPSLSREAPPTRALVAGTVGGGRGDVTTTSGGRARRGSVRDEVLLPPDRDRLEARVDVERLQDVADVVPHGLGAEVELARDLLGRTAVLEEAQHLGLPRRQVWVWRRRRLVLFDVQSLPEDADHPPAATERDGADLDRYPLAGRVDADDFVVRAGRRPDEVPGEDLPRPACFLGRDDGGELAAANVSHELARGRVQIADDPVRVDHIGGDTDAVDGVFDLTADGLEFGHASSLLLGRLRRNLGP